MTDKRSIRNERLLKEIQALTRVGGWELDVATGRVTWTDEVYRIYGVKQGAYDPSDIARDMSFYTGESLPVLQQAFDRALQHGEPYDLELAFIRADGERIWVRTIGKPEIQGGKVVRIVGNFMDVTAQKELEQKLRSTLDLLETVYASLDEAVFVVDPQSRTITSCNPAAERMYGYSKEEMIGRNTEFLHRNRGRYREFGKKLSAALKAGETFRTEFHTKRKDGTVFPSEHTVKAVGDNRGAVTLLISVVRDITEPKRAQMALEEKERLLQEKSDRLEEMNAALKVLLDQRDREKKRLESSISRNINERILPYLKQIRKETAVDVQREYLDILEVHLREVAQPFSHRISESLMRLTPSETRIAAYVKQGYGNKEIASLLHLSKRTVEFHRDNIRKKLGLKGRKINLRTYLSHA